MDKEKKENRLLSFGANARAAMMAGAKTVHDAVSVTLGPKGRNVIIESVYRDEPHVTRDGATVSKNILVDDPHERLGAELIKGAAARTARVAGDGTTTATVIAYALASEGVKQTESGAVDPMKFKAGMDQACADVVEYIKKNISADMDTAQTDILKSIALVSANGDEEIADVAFEAVKAVSSGIVTIEENLNGETKCRIIDGHSFNRGYINPAFANVPGKNKAVFTDARILITDKKIDSIKEIISIMKHAFENKYPLIVVADDVSGEALATMVKNKVNNGFLVCAIAAPFTGANKRDFLNDLAIITGGKVISSEQGMKFETMQASDFGSATSITITDTETAIVGGGGTKEAVQELARKIKTVVDDNTVAEGVREFMRVRLAKLEQGVAVISVGAPTVPELVEKKDRVDDAVKACQSALEEGYIPGGNTAFALTSKYMAVDNQEDHFMDGSFICGYVSVLKAITSPISRMIGDEKIVSKLLEGISVSDGIMNGYNVRSGQMEDDMIGAGIVEPTKVARVALENAVSVAGMLITSECSIVLPRPSKIQ